MQLDSHVVAAVAGALIRPLAWEHPYAMDVALKRQKKKKKKNWMEVGDSCPQNWVGGGGGGNGGNSPGLGGCTELSVSLNRD